VSLSGVAAIDDIKAEAGFVNQSNDGIPLSIYL
jgi:hypothetical protein